MFGILPVRHSDHLTHREMTGHAWTMHDGPLRAIIVQSSAPFNIAAFFTVLVNTLE